MTLAVGVQYEPTTPGSPVTGPLFRTLMERYLDEMECYLPLDVRVARDARGDWLQRYWERESARVPVEGWLFRYRGAAAGLAIVHRWPQCLHVAEFFVVPGHRRMGVGTAAVGHLKAAVAAGQAAGLVAMVFDANTAAVAFWRTQGFQFLAPVESPPWPAGMGLWVWPMRSPNA